MDYSKLDKVRRKAAPLQLDAVEAFAAGRLSRREFIQRATILGLSSGAIGMVIAACCGTTASPAGGQRRGVRGGKCRGNGRWRCLGQRRRERRCAVPRGEAGRFDPGRRPAAFRPARPDRDAGPRRVRRSRPRRSSSCAPLTRAVARQHRARTGDQVDARRDRQGLDVQPPPGREVARRHGLHLGRRRRHHGAPGRRPATRASRASCPRVGRSRPTRTPSPSPSTSANGNFPYLVSVFNAQTLITPADLCGRDDARQAAGRDGRMEARQLQRGNRRVLRPERRLVGWQDAARHGRVDLLRCDGPDGHGVSGRSGRCDHPVRRPVRQGPPGRPELHQPGSPGSPPSPDLDANGQGPVHRQERSPGARVCRSTDPS